nr:zinc finger BED domain-containing protein RICESLEEPER 2-like [Ipomoea batatas]
MNACAVLVGNNSDRMSQMVRVLEELREEFSTASTSTGHVRGNMGAVDAFYGVDRPFSITIEAPLRTSLTPLGRCPPGAPIPLRPFAHRPRFRVPSSQAPASPPPSSRAPIARHRNHPRFQEFQQRRLPQRTPRLCQQRRPPPRLPLRTPVADAVRRPRRSKKLDIGLAREVFAAAIVEHDCPFAFAEYPGFRKYHKLLNPDAPMISRNTLVSDINKLYLREKNKLKQVLTSIPNRICLTSDLWTACTIEGYICLTSHFVDEKWKLNSKILAFDKMPPPQESLKAASHTLHIIRESVKYAKSTESRMKKFQECVVEVGGIDTSIGLRLDMPVVTNPTKCQAYIEMLRKKLYKLYDQYVSAIGSSSSQPRSSTIMHSRVESQVAKKYPKRLFDDVLDVSDEIVEPVEIFELDRYLE